MVIPSLFRNSPLPGGGGLLRESLGSPCVVQLDAPLGTVKSALSRGLAKLRELEGLDAASDSAGGPA